MIHGHIVRIIEPGRGRRVPDANNGKQPGVRNIFRGLAARSGIASEEVGAVRGK